MLKNTETGMKRWLRAWECIILLQRTQVCFLELISGSSYPPIILLSDLTHSSCPCEHLCLHKHTYSQAQITYINIFFKSKKWKYHQWTQKTSKNMVFIKYVSKMLVLTKSQMLRLWCIVPHFLFPQHTLQIHFMSKT